MFQVDAKAERMVELLVAKWSPELIMLFGSRARGDHEEHSDYDLFVVVAEDVYRKGIGAEMRTELQVVPGAKDVVVMTRSKAERFKNIEGRVCKEAFLEGRVLYGAA